MKVAGARARRIRRTICARPGRARGSCALALLGLALLAAAAPAATLQGDLDGDGVVDAADEQLLKGLYGALEGDPLYDPAADGNGDGRIDHRDLGLFGAAFGTAGGDADTSPPGLFVTLNDIPDDQNDLLVAPPGGFRITFGLDSAGTSVVDPASLSVTSTQSLGGMPAGAELAGLFSVSPTRAVYEVPQGADLARTSHWLTVSVSDAAGNEASTVYGFAVRDFGFGAPLAAEEAVFLDFDQDRSGQPGVDFLEDLREYGLSSPAAPAIEIQVRDRLVETLVARAHEIYGRLPDGSPGPDPVNLRFHTTPPAGSYARLCVGGQSSLGGSFLGAAPLDPENLVKNEDTCTGTQNGVFPAAIDNLWGGEASYQALFGPLDPGLGGTPIGEHPADAAILDPGFDTALASTEELLRFVEVIPALDTVGSLLGTIVAHETGHLVGLVAHGAPPAGLHGGGSGGNTDHNVTATGQTPTENWVMNRGTSFSFDQIAGLGNEPPPRFRPLADAYLRNRIALSQQVTGLYPAPGLSGVSPNPVVYPQGSYTTSFQILGTGFHESDAGAPPNVSVLLEGSPTWDSVQNVTFVSPTELTGTINVFVVVPGLYDLRVINPDGQAVVLPDALEVQQP